MGSNEENKDSEVLKNNQYVLLLWFTHNQEEAQHGQPQSRAKS